MSLLDAAVAVLALAAALALRPWRLLAGGSGAVTPLLASLVILPWLWALPSLHRMPLQLNLSGAVLVLLMLGWPLAVPVFAVTGAAAALLASQGWSEAAHLATWQGIVPATLALGVGAALRQWLPPHPFVYILGRGFLGAVLSLFAAHALELWLAGGGTGLVSHWLIAWGDAMLTGMLCAIFVAYRPQWLLTWSDGRYLRPPG